MAVQKGGRAGFSGNPHGGWVVSVTEFHGENTLGALNIPRGTSGTISPADIQTNEPLRGCAALPKGMTKDENDRVVQIGPRELAASAHVIGRLQDHASHWGF